MPLISVIVPVYKVEKYLHRCVDSILKQTFTDFELILVDDGSPDNCGTICDNYAKIDRRVHVIHQENGGLSAARNAGLDWMYANSCSEWITFIDSDDWVHEKYLETLYTIAISTSMDIAICGYRETVGEGFPDFEIGKGIVYSSEDYYCNYHVNATVAWGKLYKKTCFEKIRFPKGKIHEDEYITYQMLFLYEKIAVIEQPLYAYYKNEKGIMNSNWNRKRLDIIPAREMQIQYFKNHKFDKAFELTCRFYCSNLAEVIYEMQKCKAYNVEEIAVYRKKLRKALIKYKKITGIKFCKKFFWIYENAFPKEMGIYWRALSLYNKLRKIRML